MLSATAKPRRARFVAGIEMPRVDGRTLGARRYRTLVRAYSREIGAELSEPEKALVGQVSSLQLRIEQLQSAIVAGHDVSTDELVRLSSEHRRLLTGLRKKADTNKPPAPNIHDLLAEIAEAASEAEE